MAYAILFYYTHPNSGLISSPVFAVHTLFIPLSLSFSSPPKSSCCLFGAFLVAESSQPYSVISEPLNFQSPSYHDEKCTRQTYRTVSDVTKVVCAVSQTYNEYNTITKKSQKYETGHWVQSFHIKLFPQTSSGKSQGSLKCPFQIIRNMLLHANAEHLCNFQQLEALRNCSQTH